MASSCQAWSAGLFFMASPAPAPESVVVFSSTSHKGRHTTPNALRLRLHSVAANAGWRFVGYSFEIELQ